MPLPVNRTLSVAPMMDYTDRHCRYFLRLISRHTLLYTEMVTTGALLYGDRERFLGFDASEHPLAFQLGGNDATELATCAKFVASAGYDEVNLNCGCPSDRVQTGNFGACLMKSPTRVADCIKAMVDSCDIPVTVKNRIGVDDLDSYGALCDFIGTVADAGCQTFIVHARKAWLQGLSPKQNREIPPLLYDRVYQLKTDFPALEIIINGGITSLESSAEHLKHVDGVMIGREAYHNPYMLAQADAVLFNDAHPTPSRQQLLRDFMAYAESQLSDRVRLNHLTRHILGLFAGQPGGKKFRRYISENAWRQPDSRQFLMALLSSLPEERDTEECV